MTQSNIIKAKNSTGSMITAGTVVYIVGFDADVGVSLIAPASCASSTTMPAVGVVTVNVDDGGSTNVRVGGSLAGLDTSAYPINTTVYVGLNGALAFADPYILNPAYITQRLGLVTRCASYPNGEIELLPFAVEDQNKSLRIQVGTAVVSSGSVVFASSGAGNISFGMVGSTITAFAASGGTFVGGISAAAGTQTADSGVVVWSNANNISFGMANSSVITASASYPAQTLQTDHIINSVVLSGNISGIATTISSGALSLAGGNNITLSQVGNAIIFS